MERGRALDEAKAAASSKMMLISLVYKAWRSMQENRYRVSCPPANRL